MNTTSSSKPAAKQPPLRTPGVRQSPPVVAWEDVLAACGHVERFGLYAEKQDRFRAERRKKVALRPCKACRAAKQLAEQEAAAARKAAGQHPRQVAYPMHGRLPDNSQFQASYNAAATTWSGTLTIDGRTFAAEASAVHHLLRVLDRLYRQALREKAPEPAAQDRGQE